MLSQKIEDDFKMAMKTRDALKVGTLRMLKAALGNYLIEKRKSEADDSELIALIQKQVKLREDSIEGFKKGGRKDLVAKETQEKSILEAYLPAPLTESELKNLVQNAIQALGATSKNDLGRVMKEVIKQAAGRVDGRRINQTALSLLPEK